MADPFRGKSLRWSYQDGPTAGQEYEHVFGTDGTVTYRQLGGGTKGHAASYQAARLGKGIRIMAYTSAEGWTLTTVIDQASGKIVSVASNQDQLFVQNGRLLEAAPKKGSSTKASDRRNARPSKRTRRQQVRVPR